MFKSLRNKLVLLYTISTGFILVIVMIILLTSTEGKLKEKRLEVFRDYADTIINKLQFDNRLHDSWLAQMESNNNIIIYIEDNGNRLDFKGVLHPPTARTQLIKQLTALAWNEGIYIGKNPVFFNAEKSSVFTIKGEADDVYYGMAVVIPTNYGWRSLLLLQYLPDYNSQMINQRIMYTLLGLAGAAALFLISLCFVSGMLKPMEENSRRQTEFIAAASHELRSPLAVIMANRAAISDSSPESQRFLNGITKECKRMARLIDDMLLLACMDANTWHTKNEPVETDTLLVETYEAFLPLFNQKELALSLELQEEELPVLYGDKDRLKQILAILLDNALSYTPAGKKITVRGFVSNRHLNIEVEDQGAGISDEDKKLIFNRFFRVDKSRTDKQHFGLGLCIANELVQCHGGKISVKDTLGGGATFVVHIPI